ncbi:hypothetical protein RSAG8_01757, partial [Rhizoctonia solani AG-8 WAC10335]
MPFLSRETVSSHPPSPSLASAVPPLDDLPGYQYNPMPLFSSQLPHPDNDTHGLEHPATVPPSPYEAPITGSHSPAPLEIVLPSEEIVFRGVGQDVEGALLSGHLVLNLTEATNIREITLQLTGKVQLPNTLPVSCRTYPGSASVAYKLRATAVRSAFSANFHAFRSLHIMRSFSPEAMEYNQTLEIENTWPGKIMYSFVVPHKAFAAGVDVPILVKFQPMAKGVTVQSIVTSIKEYTSVRWRGMQHQETRTVSTTRHVIRNGRAVRADQPTETDSTTPLRSRSGSHMNVFNGHGRNGTTASASTNGDAIGHAISRLHAVSSGVAMAAGISSAVRPASASGSAEGQDTQPIASTSRLNDSPGEETVDQEASDEEVDTSLHITLPESASPTSTIEPILSLYKVKFSVIISNLDGHTSELRCALPIHVMDPRLAEEVRLATNATHNLLFGSENTEESQNIDLPSRANSRANSPERGQHSHGGIDGHKLAGALHSNRAGFFHLPSAMKPFTPFAKTRNAFSSNHSSAHATTPGSASGTHTPASFHANGSGSHTPDEDATSNATVDPLARVPDYSVASRGFLGGGVTPLSRDLPSYDQAQQHVTTSASTGDMANLVRDSCEGHDELGAGPTALQNRPDMGGRHSTGDLIFMRSGCPVTQAMQPAPTPSGTQPVR